MFSVRVFAIFVILGVVVVEAQKRKFFTSILFKGYSRLDFAITDKVGQGNFAYEGGNLVIQK
jgi:hypothetical protein